MAEYASNTPISQPIKMDWTADWDVGGGLMWSYDNGLFFEPQGETLPIRIPAATELWGIT